MAGNDDVMNSRRRRINRLKKIIITTVILLIVIPVILCILCLFRIGSLKREIKELREYIAAMPPTVVTVLADDDVMKVTPEPVSFEERGGGVELHQAEPGRLLEESLLAMENAVTRRVYLTFDDGPSANTDRILDILDQYQIKGTFFVNIREEQYEYCYKRIVDEGHTIGMHSATHDYDSVYASKEAFAYDLDTIRKYIFDLTGVYSELYRFPGGSSNRVSRTPVSELVSILEARNIRYFDWNCMSGDATNYRYTAEQLKDNVLETLPESGDCVILMHDASHKDTTVEALPLIIEALMEYDDVEFFPITSQTEPVQHETFN